MSDPGQRRVERSKKQRGKVQREEKAVETGGRGLPEKVNWSGPGRDDFKKEKRGRYMNSAKRVDRVRRVGVLAVSDGDGLCESELKKKGVSKRKIRKKVVAAVQTEGESPIFNGIVAIARQKRKGGVRLVHYWVWLENDKYPRGGVRGGM